MFHWIHRGALTSAVVLIAMALTASAASASVTPALSLDQSAGDAAGSTANLGMDLTFSDSGSDSPDQMTINLPPGLLANASIDGGACLKSTSLNSACQVGSGTVTAQPLSLGVPISESVTFDLVAPPAAGDLAGLAVDSGGSQLGSTAAITVRPSGSADGVGITIDFVLPDSLDGAPISVTEIDSTFQSLRYPATCPSTRADVSVSVNSYDDLSSTHTVSAPLTVKGCSSLPYKPHLAVSVVEDHAPQVQLTTKVTQAADESPTRSLSLGFPGTTLALNIESINKLCSDVSSGTCTPVGTATAVSPLYPDPLTANAYLTGTILKPTLTLVFPSPFPLTLVGTVALSSRTTTFSGLPDIPLTSLSLVLTGGSSALFDTSCSPPSGTASGKLIDQSGDKTETTSASYRVSGCPAGAASSSSPTISHQTVTGLRGGHPSLSFRAAASDSAKLTGLTVELPAGLSFDRLHGSSGIAVGGARVKSLSLSDGHLVITLRKAVMHLSVKLTRLKESSALHHKAQLGTVGRLRLKVIVHTTGGRRDTVKVTLGHPGA